VGTKKRGPKAVPRKWTRQHQTQPPRGENNITKKNNTRGKEGKNNAKKQTNKGEKWERIIWERAKTRRGKHRNKAPKIAYGSSGKH